MSVTDNFSGTLSNWQDQNWTPGSPPGIISGAAYSSATLAFASMYWKTNTFDDNQRSSFTVKGNITYGGPAVRANGSGGSAINLYTYSAHGSLQKFLNGAQSVLGVTPPTSSVNDVIAVDATSTTISTYRNGAFGVSTGDASIASGSAGIQWYHNTLGADDWVGTGEKFNATYSFVALSGSYSASGTAAKVVRGRVFSLAGGTYSYTGTNADLKYPTYRMTAQGTSYSALFATALLRRTPIDVDATSSGYNGSLGALTFAHTCNGSNRLLLVGVVGDVTADDIVSATYNGVALTLVQKIPNAAGTRYSYVYQLINPDLGTHNIVITPTGNHLLVGVSASYVGIRQSAQPDTFAVTNSGSNTTSFTSSLTPTVANCWVMLLSFGYNGDVTQPTAGTGAFHRVHDLSFGLEGLFDSNKTVAAGSPYSMTTNRSSGAQQIYHFMGSYAAGGLAYVVTGTPGSYAWTGSTASLSRGPRSLIASSGAYAYTGTPVTLGYTRRLQAASGTFSYTGTNVQLKPIYPLSVTSGSYSWTGSTVQLRYQRRLATLAGTFAWTGTAATLSVVHKISPVSGSYTWVGTSAQLKPSRKLVADPASYSYTGTAATLTASGVNITYKLTALSGAYGATGTNAKLILHRRLIAEVGNYATGAFNFANLIAYRLLKADVGTYTWTGSPIAMRQGIGFSGESGIYTWQGTDAQFFIERVLTVGSGTYSSTGTPVQLRYTVHEIFIPMLADDIRVQLLWTAGAIKCSPVWPRQAGDIYMMLQLKRGNDQLVTLSSLRSALDETVFLNGASVTAQLIDGENNVVQEVPMLHVFGSNGDFQWQIDGPAFMVKPSARYKLVVKAEQDASHFQSVTPVTVIE